MINCFKKIANVNKMQIELKNAKLKYDII